MYIIRVRVCVPPSPPSFDSLNLFPLICRCFIFFRLAYFDGNLLMKGPSWKDNLTSHNTTGSNSS